MHILIQIIFVLLAWRWGDWRNWNKYYSTILFLITGDLIYNFVNYNDPLWTYTPDAFEKWVYQNHTLITLGADFLGFPALVLLYLGHYPKGKIKQILYVVGWVLFQSTVEALSHFIAKGISYSNGWHYGFSVLFNIFFYVIIRVHDRRPLWAWVIAISVILIRLVFILPLHTMK